MPFSDAALIELFVGLARLRGENIVEEDCMFTRTELKKESAEEYTDISVYLTGDPVKARRA
eukprot:CAMPEP_0170491832 /NCGR_PEP_ID=MMETSP0208-20121228/11280_1 /TAXON_ID=197538 /ORGANISM="Strombidium inclinatum, Strain S3" /LENGTH=60 /DNA_ID=CAMNT_0010767473 /DNA_START=664 /DNA_END=847 /DNA_ORIENTATION=-